ncbi:MAG: hypothetical protein KC478_00340 [Bacteriovoracaceae bacterium]|nr:hypothetical protein [Bacteriovoracaceae bacterium]
MFLLIFSFFNFSLYSAYGSDLMSGPISFSEGEYKNFSITKNLKSQLKKHARLSFKVINPSKQKKMLYLVFEDKNSKDYWSKLNFKTTLVPGENELIFNLKRFVGERGSVRHKRGIDYNSLKKAFVYIDPEQGSSAEGKFKLTNVKLSNPPKLKTFGGLRAFVFGKKFDSEIPDVFKPISSDTKYGSGNPHGFTSIDLWRVNDAAIAPKWLSETIGVNKAQFRVTLPPGEYNYRLVWDELGYWDVPFWKNRMLSINGSPERKEARSGMSDFLDDYLSLMGEPRKGEHPYDYYFSKVFRPVEGTFTVKKSYVDFTFEGDPTGVSLNYLVIWPVKNKKAASKFLTSMHELGREGFNQKYRKVGVSEEKIKALGASFHNSPGPLLSGKKCDGRKSAKLVSAPNGNIGFDLCVSSSSSESVAIKISDFTSRKAKIKSEALEVSKYIYRYKSIDLNHETYQLMADTLSLVKDGVVDLNGHKTRYLNVRVKGADFTPGLYKGTVSIKQGESEQQLPVELVVLKKNYPKTKIKAGVIGLSPFPKTYFSSAETEQLNLAYHQQAKMKLEQAGLVAFTDIPSLGINYNKAKSKFTLMDQNANDFLANTKLDKVFFYDGSFPRKFLNDNLRNAGQSKEGFYSNLKNELEKFKSKHKAKDFIYLYSDEATGYRNAVKEDALKIAEYKKIFPSLKLGGFGNLYDWGKGQDLYKLWDFGLYADIPNKVHINRLKSLKQEFGVYNICAEPQANLEFCFGPMMYRLEKSGVDFYFEWHASAIHNYPGFDLDGREADIAFFYPTKTGEVAVTRRFVQASKGVEIFNKLKLINHYLNSRKAPGLKERNAKVWLKKLERKELFPIKDYKIGSEGMVSALENELDKMLKTLVSY